MDDKYKITKAMVEEKRQDMDIGIMDAKDVLQIEMIERRIWDLSDTEDNELLKYILYALLIRTIKG